MYFSLVLGFHFITLASAGTWSSPSCYPGRHTIVLLMEWKWTDIAQECERFLGPYGYCGVQISPPNENGIVTNPNRPWWERYQPVSYKLITRSGNEQQFRDMVERCHRVNVIIIADVVINHMTGEGAKGVGTAGDHFDANDRSFPAVPYLAWDFNSGAECPSQDGAVKDYNNPQEVRNCELFGLLDLKLSKDYVRQKVTEYLNKLLDIGVGGFRVDSAKNMWPGDLQAIFGRLHNLNSSFFSGQTTPFILLEVIDFGQEAVSMSEYTNFARVTNFIYGLKLVDIFKTHSLSQNLSNFGSPWGMPASNDVIVFVDNHDNQRGHGPGGGVLTHWEPRSYKMGNAFMLAHQYGFPRLMSSFFYDRSDDSAGPPHNADMSTMDVQINANMSCGGGWVCEHRWRQIYNMVAFRNVVMGTNVQHWWSKNNYQIAFARGNKGFIVFNEENYDLNETLQTGLPQGTYCDVISGNYENGDCTGTKIQVGGDGSAPFHISNSSPDPMVAIHIGAKIGSAAKITT